MGTLDEDSNFGTVSGHERGGHGGSVGTFEAHHTFPLSAEYLPVLFGLTESQMETSEEHYNFGVRSSGSAATWRWKWKCKQGIVTFVFVSRADWAMLHSGKPEDLPRITSEIQIVIKPVGQKEGQFSARFPSKECLDLLAGEWPLLSGAWPCDANFDHIARAVRERKNYPMPEPEIPGGGKSMTAQGQTKKSGSHSQDKHR